MAVLDAIRNEWALHGGWRSLSEHPLRRLLTLMSLERQYLLRLILEATDLGFDLLQVFQKLL